VQPTFFSKTDALSAIYTI